MHLVSKIILLYSPDTSCLSITNLVLCDLHGDRPYFVTFRAPLKSCSEKPLAILNSSNAKTGKGDKKRPNKKMSDRNPKETPRYKRLTSTQTSHYYYLFIM
jgi:hypothetical protein